jgi:ankyrin repeat protein
VKFARKLTGNSLVNVNAVNAAGHTPLMLAADSGRTDMVEAVLAGKPNVNVQDKVCAAFFLSLVVVFRLSLHTLVLLSLFCFFLLCRPATRRCTAPRAKALSI